MFLIPMMLIPLYTASSKHNGINCKFGALELIVLLLGFFAISGLLFTARSEYIDINCAEFRTYESKESYKGGYVTVTKRYCHKFKDSEH